MENKTTGRSRHRGRNIILAILGVLVVGLIVFRLYLPSIVLKYVNKKLDNIPDYQGHVDDITMSLWRGAYQIQGISLNKLNGKVPVPFFSAKTIDLSVEWKALFHGSIVGKIKFIHPVVNFVKGPTEATSQTKVDKSWVQTVRDLIPLKINRFDIDEGEIHFRDFHSSPKVDIFLHRIMATATNLSNSRKNDKVLPSDVDVTATCFESGALNLQMALDPLNENPTFELKERISDVQLAKLNDFLFAYAKVKVNKGTFGLYSEIAAKGGSFKGYSKPIIKDIEIDRSAQEDKTLLQKLWAGVVAGAAWVLTNSEKDQVATKIPIEGKFNQPSVDIWSTIGSLLKNAFIQALSPSFEEAVHISDVPGGKAVADEKTAEKKKEKKEEKDKIKKEEDKKEDKKDGKKKKKHFWQRRSA